MKRRRWGGGEERERKREREEWEAFWWLCLFYKCVCMSECMCVCVYVCECVCASMHACVHVCEHAHVHITCFHWSIYLYAQCCFNTRAVSQMHMGVQTITQSHHPINGHLLHKDIHGGQQQVMVLPECTQHMNHGVLQHTLHLQWQANIDNLPSQANRHQLWHWKKLQPARMTVRIWTEVTETHMLNKLIFFNKKEKK